MLGVEREEELPPRSTRLVPEDGRLEPDRDRIIGSEARRSFVGVERSTRLFERSGRLRVADPLREELRTSFEPFTRDGEESAPGVRETLEGVLTLPEEPRDGSPAVRQPLSLPPERTLLEDRTSEFAAPPRALEVERTDAERSPPRTPGLLAPGLERKSRTEVAIWFRC
jgi:hypothetical protein